MKKKYIISLILSVTLVAVALSHISTNVGVDGEIHNTNITQESIQDNTTYDNEFIEVPKILMTVALASKTINKEDVKTEDSIAKIENEQDNINNTSHMIASRGGSVIDEVDFILSFYTTLPKENGSHTVTCKGVPLNGLEDAVASNVYPLNSKIYLEGGYGEVTVLDKGGRDFNKYNRLDVLIQRERKDNGQWESDYEYEKRVNRMGHVKVKGYILK